MRRHTFFIGILIVVAAVRFTILFLSRTHVHSDEAIIGLMGKHILEGRYFPFYMYGQPYNAGAAWEAYLAVLPFVVFGVGVIPLKSCIVALSLVCLFLFYRMCRVLYGERTAVFATVVFGLAPSLLKWHFQVRGYSWYFLSIPVITSVFLSIQSSPNPKRRQFFLFGLASGLSIWSLELVVTLDAAFWIMLLLGRNSSFKKVLVAAGGFLIGYAPAIAFNVTHHFSNWQCVIAEKTAGVGLTGGLMSLFRPSTFVQIFAREMPKFFGPDTILWYYPEKTASGFIFYAIALLAIGRAIWPFLKTPSRIGRAFRKNLMASDEEKDLLLLVLTSACFIPYLSLPFGVPSYFLGGCFFLSALTARLLERSFVCSRMLVRLGGAAVFTAILVTGIGAMLDTARHNQIETLTSCDNARSYCMTRIPGADIEGVEQHLRRHEITSVWTTVSFVYPLLFESRETLAVSDAIFGYEHQVYPPAIPAREPSRDQHAAFVIETNSILRPPLALQFSQATGTAPLISEYGMLTVIEGRSRYGFLR